MAKHNVITSMLDDLCREQPIQTALCMGQNLAQYDSAQTIHWQHFSVSELLSLPFTQRYDLAVVFLDLEEIAALPQQHKTQMLVKLRDLFAKRLVVVCLQSDTQLMRALGLTKMLDQTQPKADLSLWQFNILTYKHVPDWFNSKFWANPENWNKFRW
ncbi:DUF6231 family protein [Acinetobacter sp. MD2(2019)]|uniref:DUF6231 family protein n=1 Tax=Acinetobacter sp. MD2(2019) TaxID=2605273 RepID=UPI002D1F5F11|nr:DUF6231 family protein [Acinetobacter sp. MD2(2019)]MEB3752954.1 hypothetical protein [Acinetobacter sp. MD2(2019)]